MTPSEAQDAERQEEQPDQRRQDEHDQGQGQGPADHQQDAPENERGHGSTSGFKHLRHPESPNPALNSDPTASGQILLPRLFLHSFSANRFSRGWSG